MPEAEGAPSATWRQMVRRRGRWGVGGVSLARKRPVRCWVACPSREHRQGAEMSKRLGKRCWAGCHRQEGFKRGEAAGVRASGGRATAASRRPCRVQGSLALVATHPGPRRCPREKGWSTGAQVARGLDWVGGDPRSHWKLVGGCGAQGGIGLPDPHPQSRHHSPRSGMWRTMFPATPSSST